MNNSPTRIFSVLSAIALLHIAVLFAAEPLLFFDEAQYWTWAKSLDFGYFSKPPMVAWLIAGTTSICGDGSACVKLSAPILHLISAVFVFLTSAKLFNQNIATWAALLYITMPGVVVGSEIISADAPLMAFWSASFYFLIMALRSDSYKYYILLGVSAGLAMMSKYTMGAFFISIFLLFILTPQYRRLFISPKIWLSAAITIAAFSPNIIWNLSNSFISLSHTSDNVLDGGRFKLHIIDTLEFIGAQFAIFSPLMFGYLITLFPHRLRGGLEGEFNNPIFTLKIFTFTLLTIAIIVSLIAGAQAHWAAPLYIAGVILVASTVPKWMLKTSLILNIIIMIAVMVGQFFWQPPRAEKWNNAAIEIQQISQQYPTANLVADERKAVAVMMYVMRDDTKNLLKWNADKDHDDYYDMTTDMNNHIGEDFIMLTRGDGNNFKKYFTKIQIIKEFVEPTKNSFRILYLKNFKGY